MAQAPIRAISLHGLFHLKETVIPNPLGVSGDF